MDLDNFFSFLQSSLDLPTLNEDYPLESDTLVAQPVPQPSSPSQSLTLLKAFCSDEDTVKSYLLNDEFNQRDYERLQYYHSSVHTFDSCLSNDLLTIGNLTPTSNSSTITSDSVAVKSNIWSKINDENFNLKSNFILLVQLGYKLTLSLNTDNNEVEEPWNPDVSQKILSVNFSSLNMRTEFLSDDPNLDVFESLLMDEAIEAFKSQRSMFLFEDITDKSRARASPHNLISMLDGIKGYRKIESNDKITILSNAYYQLNLLQAILDYDSTIDGWGDSEFKFDRRDVFVFNRSLYDGVVHILETFPDRLRNDKNVGILLYLIIIFNADSSELKYPEMIRHEQFSYIYLLRRYLRTICATDCEASDNHYRLMVKIEQIKLLDKQTKSDFVDLLREPIVISITRAIMGYVYY